uniref:Uncharacterized protein n=1 Tax=Anopheles merus TaxID=30066 RepID=A0A182VI65_ANOME
MVGEKNASGYYDRSIVPPLSSWRVVSWMSMLVVGSLIGEAVLLPRGPAYALRILGSGWAAVTTIPPVRNLLPGLTPGDGTPLGRSGAPPFPVPLGPADSGPAVDGTLSSALRGEPAVERELLVVSSRRDCPTRADRDRCVMISAFSTILLSVELVSVSPRK